MIRKMCIYFMSPWENFLNEFEKKSNNHVLETFGTISARSLETRIRVDNLVKAMSIVVTFVRTEVESDWHSIYGQFKVFYHTFLPLSTTTMLLIGCNICVQLGV